jgi:hypothetical protein
MIVICEECGKKYHLRPDMIHYDEAWITCRFCRHRFTVAKPASAAPAPPPEDDEDAIEVIGSEELIEVEPAGAVSRMRDAIKGSIGRLRSRKRTD